MEAPDFGWQLARQVAACGLRSKLPADDPFFWIRLAAEQPDSVGEAAAGEDPCRRALRLAKDLHQRPAARHLLQAALLTREAEIGEVAAFLSLDPRGVAAYATLFFNVPGRVDEEEGFKQLVTRRYASDCDRSGGDPARSRQGLAEPLRRAPQLTLEQLQWLLGFKAPCEEPAAAARMLLRYLSELAPGQGAFLAGDDEEPRKPRRAVQARRNSADFEQAVEAAGKWMEARHFGSAALIAGLGDALGDMSRDATKYGFMLQTYIDSGLTEEEAVGKLQADKEERRAEKRRQMESQTRKNHG
jgi:hypothetical protein